MAKVFTITEGLENMGALKTGGQGSVYKGRRDGETITAIKILPTPIHSETADDKNYTSFMNEVQKLKKVNEEPNPNVVTILSSGFTESGNFPYIEMEFIEGPDLEELLQPPHPSVFSIDEVLKIAEQLSFAIAHCHKIGVKHGDIKSNNIKYNVATNNYVLLDFGLAVMSDEQRRTSFRQAGAIEFMAPEQSDGQMLFETDVYSFGIVLYELLAGSVPFPLKSKGEISRNHVVIAHIETPPPDILTLRQQALFIEWDDDRKQQEMQVPAWLLGLISKCLEKKPHNRFANGMELHTFIKEHTSENTASAGIDRVKILEEENKKLRLEKELFLDQLKKKETGRVSSNIVDQPASSQHSARSLTRTSLVNGKNVFFGFIVILLIVLGVYFLTGTKNKTGIQPVAFKKDTSVTTPAPMKPEVAAQLENAKRFLSEDKTVEALIIYSALVKQEVPEAMYQYGKLALQNKNRNITCVEAADLLQKAGNKGSALAKRTLGMLYSFADDEATLKAGNYYDRCNFNKDVVKGSKLLMEAMLEGDVVAGNLLDELQKRQK